MEILSLLPTKPNIGLDSIPFSLPDKVRDFLFPAPIHNVFKAPQYGNEWGIFDSDGIPVFLVDTCVSVHFSRKYRVSHFPIEEKAFADYNKVAEPYTAKVKLAVGSAVSGGFSVSRFLSDLETVAASTDLFHVVTPERTYLNANVESYDFQRSSDKGVSMIVADLSLIEVREVTPSFSQETLPKAPKAKKAEKPGDKKTVTASEPQRKSLADMEDWEIKKQMLEDRGKSGEPMP